MAGSDIVHDLREAATLSPVLAADLVTLKNQGYVGRAAYDDGRKMA